MEKFSVTEKNLFHYEYRSASWAKYKTLYTIIISIMLFTFWFLSCVVAASNVKKARN